MSCEFPVFCKKTLKWRSCIRSMTFVVECLLDGVIQRKCYCTQHKKLSIQKKTDVINSIEKVKCLRTKTTETFQDKPILFEKSVFQVSSKDSPNETPNYSNTKFQERFYKYLDGYHYVNNDVLKEAKWESINSSILKKCGETVYKDTNGDHSPGVDIVSSLGRQSNKTAKLNSRKNTIDISSYRNTKLCRNNNIETIVKGIEDKCETFDFYSLLVRDESLIKTKQKLKYQWYNIPKSVLSINDFHFEAFYKGNGEFGGWKSNKIHSKKEFNSTIVKSMSYQLWLVDIPISYIEKYLIAETTCDLTDNIDYEDVHKIKQK